MAICLQRTGLAIEQDGGSLYYDEPCQALLNLTPASVFIYRLNHADADPQEVRLTEGPPPVAAALSLDGRTLALQRSAGHLQFMELASSKTFVQGPFKGRANVLGFFWTSTPDCCFVMVTKLGVETYQLHLNKQGLALVQQLSHTVRWWQYSHRARLLLLGTGEAGSWLQALQFSSESLLRLPPLQILSSAAPASGAAPLQSGLGAETVSILTLYGRIYCSVLERRERCLSLYRFYKDAIVLQHRIEVASSKVQLSTVDDLLLIFHARTGQAMAVDVAVENATFNDLTVEFPEADDGESRDDEQLRMGRLLFKLPNVIIDPTAQEILRNQVDVEAIARGSKDWPKVIGFVLRRSPQMYRIDLSGLAISLLREALVERIGSQLLRQVCDVLTAHQAGRMLPAAQRKAQLTPQEVCRSVFEWLHTEEAVDAHYLQAAIVEYRASAASLGVELPLMLQFLSLEVALQLGQAYQVALEVSSSHDADCRELAARLDGCASLAHHQQLADDMRLRVEDHDRHCAALLERGKVLEAVRLIHKHSLRHLVNSELLVEASKLGDIPTSAAVYRFCSQYLPADQLPEYRSYLQPQLGAGA